MFVQALQQRFLLVCYLIHSVLQHYVLLAQLVFESHGCDGVIGGFFAQLLCVGANHSWV